MGCNWHDASLLVAGGVQDLIRLGREDRRTDLAARGGVDAGGER